MIVYNNPDGNDRQTGAPQPADATRGAVRVSSAEVYAEIRRLILSGVFRPGERLIEESVAQRLGVSRTPVRQALTMLEAEGLVEIVRHRGATVCAFGVDDVWSLYDLRAVLEAHAAGRAATRISAAELERMRALADEMERLEEQPLASREDEVRWLVTHNQEFHQIVIQASRNPHLEKLVRRTVEVPLMFKSFFWYSARERAVSNHFHRMILRALEERDAARAEFVMREHIYEGRDFVIQKLREELR
ncbi:MAG: GntR family transcriptional regulator [Sphaerobacter sp.]|nr:GntR family transcriptional regulator [Sphaerobacter sp.]